MVNTHVQVKYLDYAIGRKIVVIEDFKFLQTAEPPETPIKHADFWILVILIQQILSYAQGCELFFKKNCL